MKEYLDMDKIYKRKIKKFENPTNFRMHQSNDFLESKYNPGQNRLENNIQQNIMSGQIKGPIKSMTRATNIHTINANLEFNMAQIRQDNDFMENQSLVSGMDMLLNERGQFVHANFKG